MLMLLKLLLTVYQLKGNLFMKVVNATERKCAAQYMAIPQPMFVYHTVDEFNENVENPIVISSLGVYVDFLRERNIEVNYTPQEAHRSFCDEQVWIKTVDKYIPDYADAYNNIFYLTDTNGDTIATDGCFVRLYFMIPTNTTHVLFTSAGINTVSMGKWAVTAAVRTQFIQESKRRFGSSKEDYDKALARMLYRKRANTAFTKIAIAVMSPTSPAFCDFDKAVLMICKGKIKSADRRKLVHSHAFKESMMQILKIIYPELGLAIREKHTGEAMAGYLVDAFAEAKASKSVDKMLTVFDKIKEVAYESADIVSDNTGVPMLNKSNATPPKLISGEKLKKVEVEDDDDYVDKILLDAGADDLTDEELKLRKEELSYPDSFISDANPKPLIDISD